MKWVPRRSDRVERSSIAAELGRTQRVDGPAGVPVNREAVWSTSKLAMVSAHKDSIVSLTLVNAGAKNGDASLSTNYEGEQTRPIY